MTAATGSGKTWIAETAIKKRLDAGQRAWYASPLKALSNTLYTHFQTLFGADAIGILTGDRKENSDAPIIIGTTEILRNQLYDAMHQGETLNADFLVIDEAHFLGDPDRGVVWEETLIYLPVRIPLLLLSATIGNAGQISKWLTAIRGRACTVIRSDRRPVPLFPLFLHPAGTLTPLMSEVNRKRGRGLHKRVVDYLKDKKPPRLARGRMLPPMGEILKVLKTFDLLPAIFFLKSRADCDRAITLCPPALLDQDPDRKARLLFRLNDRIKDAPHIARHPQRQILEQSAVGAHHSGQLPGWKAVIEHLMAEGLLDAIFATSTVAAGVNFPARTIVILNSDRFNGEAFLPLSASEFHQMTGRAGRRGKDRIGFALMLPGPFMDLSAMARLVSARPDDVTSQIRINFSMVLNLLLSHSPEQIKAVLIRSFAAFTLSLKKDNADPAAGAEQLWFDFLEHLRFLKMCGYVDRQDRLTDEGLWASRLRVDQPLLMAEGIRNGLLPDRDPSLLAAMIAAMVSDREADDKPVDTRRIPKVLLQTYLNIRKKLRPFAMELMDAGFHARHLYLEPGVTVYAWANGQTWEKVVRTSGMAEGDIARLTLRTADHLRHLFDLHDTFPKLAATARIAMDRILKAPITTLF